MGSICQFPYLALAKQSDSFEFPLFITLRREWRSAQFRSAQHGSLQSNVGREIDSRREAAPAAASSKIPRSDFVD